VGIVKGELVCMTSH